MNKKFTNESYLTIQQSIHNPNHKTKLSHTKTIYNKSNKLRTWTNDIWMN